MKWGVVAGALLPLAATVLRVPTARAEDVPMVTDVAELKPIVDALGYVAKSEKADQTCGNCQLYAAGSDGKGKCQLFQQGLVAEDGWCLSWTKKV